MKTIAFFAAIAAAAVTVSAASTPAFAQPQGNFGSARVTYNEATGQYCFKQIVTGSLIPVTECRTKEEWADAGLKIRRAPATQLAQR